MSCKYIVSFTILELSKPIIDYIVFWFLYNLIILKASTFIDA